ncbi:hypothetical protein FOL46_007081 [Perkinsus olseni]|nr:hypothetical protein FOL46_007081 [Perkinsus olseni]
MGNVSDGGFGGLLDQYREISEAMPLTVQCVQGPILIIIADILAQWITGAPKIDKRRCFRAALCQLIVFGPMTYFWYDILLPSWSDYLPTTAHKVLVDQTLWCWTFLSTFFFIQSLAGGMSIAESIGAVKSNLGPALKANYCFWPMMQYVNMYYTPQHLRLLVLLLVNVPWTAFLCVAQNRKRDEPQKKSQEMVEKDGKKRHRE